MTTDHDLIPAWVEDTLSPVDKLRVHKEGLRHKAVSVFVTDGDLVLIQRRAIVKYHTPGLWANTCCTHPLWGESARDCAVRRLKEELGITGVSPVHRGVVEYRADVGGGMVEHEVVDLFLAESSAKTLSILPNPAEVMETRWITLPDLDRDLSERPELYTPWLRIYMAEHRARLFS